MIYVLVIGWRASELNFLRMWSGADKYTQPRILVVNASAQSGAQTLTALGNAGIRTSEREASEGGFSDMFQRPEQFTRFLNARLPGLNEAHEFGHRSR